MSNLCTGTAACHSVERPRVLVIEDEKTLGKSILRSLTQEDVSPAPLEFAEGDPDFGMPIKRSTNQSRKDVVVQFDADLVDSVEGASTYLKADHYDIYLVDLKLRPHSPENAEAAVEEGLALIARIHALSKTAGIIVLSGEDARDRTVASVVRGANFYLQKPVGAPDLRKVVSALWKKIEHQRPRKRTFRLGEWTFTFDCRTLRNESGDEIELSALEYQLLLRLIQAENHEVHRASFAKQVFGGEHVENDRRVDSLKKRLANRLGETVQIVQLRELGYKLVIT